MVYIEDTDLAVLAQCSNEELSLLVELIQGASTQSLALSKTYQEHYPNHRVYWKEIAEEIQLFGGNSFANVMRGHGVVYREICIDVAEHLEVSYSNSASVEQIEEAIVKKVERKAIERMNTEEQSIYINALQEKTSISLTGGANIGLAVVLATILPGGFLALSITGPAYRITIPAVLLIAYFRRKQKNAQ